MRDRIGELFFPFVAVTALALVGLSNADYVQAQSDTAPKPAVTVVEVASQDVAPTQSYTGRVTAIDKVDLIARVPGFIVKQNFEEGTRVDQGELLFQLEQAPYEASLDEAKGTLEASEGEAKLAELERDRQATLVERQVVAQAVLDNAEASFAKANGDTLRSQGLVKQAELNLGYTAISAPFAGRIGVAQYSEGAYVGPDSGTLAVLVSQDPIYVAFPAPAREVLAIQKQQLAGEREGAEITFALKLADGTAYDQAGTFSFADVEVNPGTDSIEIRGTFPNADGLLIDQALVTVLVQTEAAKPTLVVPQEAVQFDQLGRFVLALDQSDKVAVRRVTVGEQLGALIAVTDGLAAGDRVIIEGIQKVRPDMVVDPTVVPMPEATTAVAG